MYVPKATAAGLGDVGAIVLHPLAVDRVREHGRGPHRNFAAANIQCDATVDLVLKLLIQVHAGAERYAIDRTQLLAGLKLRQRRGRVWKHFRDFQLARLLILAAIEGESQLSNYASSTAYRLGRGDA